MRSPCSFRVFETAYEPAPAPWGGPGSANVGAGRAAGPVVTVTEANLRAERPRPLPPAEQERADRLWWMNDLLDAHTLPEAYRTRSGGYRALHDASAFNEDLARLAAQREAERLDRARRVRDAERRYVAWVLAVLRALEARAAADGGARYAATIAYLGARVTEVSARYRADARLTEALEREHGAAGSHALAQAEAFAAERAARAPVVRRDAAYAAYGGMELLGRGLVDAAVGMVGLDAFIAPLLPDGAAQRGGFLAGLVLAPLISGVRGAAAIGTVGLDTVRALARAPRVGNAARAAAEGARDWRRAEAARTARLGGGPAGVGGRAGAGGRAGMGGRLGTTAADDTITVFRGMGRAEFEALERTGAVTSKGQRFGSIAEEGLAARIRHSWGPSFRRGATSPVDTPYVSTSEISRLAGGYSKGSGDVVVKLVLRRSDVVRGLNPHQAEVLVRGGSRVGEYAVVPSGSLSWGPRGALVRSALGTGAAVAPAGVAGYAIGETIRGD